MKTAFRKVMLFCSCIAMVFMLCSCDSGVINTVLSIDEAFSGTRVISFDVKKADLGGVLGLGGVLNGIIGAPTVEGIVETLEKSCPQELEMSTTKEKNDVHCTFTLSFADKDEYIGKVTSLLGRKPSVDYAGPSEDLFVSGITLKENFTSADLMTWASEALKAEYPKYADKVSMTVEKGDTVVKCGDSQYKTGTAISVSPVFTPLDRVFIRTTRYGDNDYIRSVEVSISPENLELIGKDNLTERFLQPLSENVKDITTAGWKDGIYTISMRQGSLGDLSRFTESVFAGSTVSYDADSNRSAFTESGALSENINFSGFVCNDDYTANVTMIYTTTDETKFMDSGDGSLAADGKTYTIVADGVNEKGAKIISETRYMLESIGVTAKVSITGNTTIAVILNYPMQSSRSASELAAGYFREEFADTGVTVDVRNVGVTEENGMAVIGTEISSTDAAGKYSVVFLTEGKPEEINEALKAAFGEGNEFSVTQGEFMKFYIDNDVDHAIDLSEIISLAQYGGGIDYTFSGTYTKVRNVNWTDTTGAYANDVLAGQENKETFIATALPCVPFTISYQYSSINIPLILLSAAAGIGILLLLMLVSNIINKKLRAKKNKKKEKTAIEAVKCVALAALPEDKRGELRELPKELTQRPMVVLEPRNDDGLDDDEDDPEGIQLFANTLRLLAITVAVLFFFPFCNVQRTSLLGNSATLSGWNLFSGKELFGVAIEPYRFALVLLIIPIITLLLLIGRRKLPRLIIPLFVTGSSLLAAFYLLQLPDILTARIETLKTAINDYVTDPAFQMGYTYSIIIYVLLALGGIMLLFSDLSFMLSQKRKEADK